jgi:hypothetical protein
MKRKVLSARLHDMKFVIAGMGQLETVLPPQRKTYPGLEMWYDGSILCLMIAGKPYGIPLANVMLMEFGPEELLPCVSVDSNNLRSPQSSFVMTDQARYDNEQAGITRKV